MAFGTMARPVHEISAAVILRRLCRIGDESSSAEEQQLPDAEQPAFIERE